MNRSVYLEASNPQKHIWVSASAGSGKTKTLTDRFIRLMLNGVEPDKILCITFTKVAASEMLNRIRNTLAKWSSLTDAELESELEALGQSNSSNDLNKARSLFSNFIDSQENLQIQTLHSFCQRLLQKFPLESGLKINSKVMTDHQKTVFIERTKNSFLEKYESELQNPIYLSYLVSNIHEMTLENLLEKVTYISGVSTLLSKEEYLQKCYDSLGVNTETCDIKIRKSYDTLFAKIHSCKSTLSSHTQELSDIIDVCFKFLESKDLAILKPVFLTATGTPRKTLITKKHQTLFPELADILIEIRDLVYEHTQNEILKHTLYNSMGFIDMLFLFNEKFSALKKEHGYLDYDDIISASIDLLSNQEFSSWIEAKLNAKIEHLMVDESQDVNLKQWKVIHTCIKDFFSGATNTLFVVGDQKQSIYSFQGSSPELFMGMKHLLNNKASEFEKEITSVDFHMSFRSDSLVLNFVDSVFKNIEQINPNYFCENSLKHEAYKAFDQASIELWPLITNHTEKEANDDWHITTEYQEIYNPAKTLAKILAKEIKTKINIQGFMPSDFMILVRKRDAFTDYMVNALKEEQIPVSGLDRIILKDNIVVKDLISLMKFVITPEDDYNLACLLKSPLFDITEDELLDLCRRDERSLWENLQKKPEIKKYLASLLENSSIHQPYKLLSHCLDIQGNRKNFLSRLGLHSSEIIDEFLDICLEFEETTISSLISFIQWFSNSNIEVKKELDAPKHEVKIMTIHASKGLQSKFVILPDTTSVPQNKDKIIFDQLNDIILYNSSENHRPEYQKILENTKLRTLQEYYRLLYVALTRAKTNILICGHNNTDTISDLSWYKILHKTIQEHSEEINCDNLHGYQRSEKKISGEQYFISNSDHIYRNSHGNITTNQEVEIKDKKESPLPDFLQKAYKEEIINSSLSPSTQVSTTDPQTKIALETGKLVHKALEYFVPQQKQISEQDVKEFLSTFQRGTPSVKLIQNICTLANRYILPLTSGYMVITESKISKKYKINDSEYTMSGTMDLVIFRQNDICIIDYKTDKNIPIKYSEISEKYIRQMSIYKDMLKSTHPDKKIHCYLAWTSSPRLTKLQDNLEPNFKDLESI